MNKQEKKDYNKFSFKSNNCYWVQEDLDQRIKDGEPFGWDGVHTGKNSRFFRNCIITADKENSVLCIKNCNIRFIPASLIKDPLTIQKAAKEKIYYIDGVYTKKSHEEKIKQLENEIKKNQKEIEKIKNQEKVSV